MRTCPFCSVVLMAKQKDLGDTLEIYFEKDRDKRKKFQKFIRSAVTHERKNIYIDMTYAPTLPRDYLASLVFGAQALKSHGYKVTFTLSPQNYTLLKNSEHASHFEFEIGQAVSDEEIQQQHPPQSSGKFLSIEGNVIHVADEGVDELPEKLSGLVKNVLKHHKKVILDITQVFLLTPRVIQAVIMESLGAGNAMRVRMLESMKEVLDSNPQAMVLDIEIISEQGEDVLDDEEAFGLDFSAEDSQAPTLPAISTPPVPPRPPAPSPSPAPSPPPATTSMPPTPSAPEPVLVAPLEEEPPEGKGQFKIEVNRLRVGRMSIDEFRNGFNRYFHELFSAGKKLVIDLSEFGHIDGEIAMHLLMANFEALSQEKELRIQMLGPQKEKMEALLPVLEEVEDRKDITPKFAIIGSRMELYNVSEKAFLDQFQQNFKKLLGSGHKKLVVDISHLQEFSNRAVELLVLSYLEAVGRGLAVTLRIRPEMEDNFLKSGRGRMLPLEIVRPELMAKSSSFGGGDKALDMSKIRDAMDKDKLTDKVLNKEFAAVHIESRGSVHNWEPSPVKAEDKIIKYDGPERRKEKRYQGKGLEVAFAKGTLGKISGRHYSLHNISNSGAGFVSAISVSRSEPVRLKIFSGDSSIELSAKVVWSSPVPSQALFQMGVQFTRVSEVAKMQIKDLIGKLYQG